MLHPKALGSCALALAVLISVTARAQVTREELPIDGMARSVVRFAAAGTEPRPAILILHGSSGLDFGTAAYDRYAVAIAEKGIDAYVVGYFKRGTGELCQCWDTWTQTISEVVSNVLRRPESSQKIGLLGFSLGGAVAVANARDERIGVVAAYGAFLPYDKRAWPNRLPPSLLLHGEADESVPLRSARELAEWARGLGGRVALQVYPGEGHRPSQWREQSATDSLNRALTFFRDELQRASAQPLERRSPHRPHTSR